VKYLQYGVYRAGLSNQLMSLELGVGLAYLTNRVLVPRVAPIPCGRTLIRGTKAPHILDLFDVPNPVIMPGQRIPADGSDLVGRDFDGNLVTTAMFFPSDLDINSDDARAFADGREWRTFDDSLQMADVVRLHWRSTLGFYSYVFYVPQCRERLFTVIRRVRPKEYYIAFAAAIQASIGSTFNAVHIRRTDFRKEDPAWVHPSPGAILENMLAVLPRDELLLLCTDEPCRSWFRPIVAEYKNHLFLDDFILRNSGVFQLPFCSNAVHALITMLVAAHADRFMGTLLSTFTSIIQRWRGQNGKALSFEYVYNPLGEYVTFQRGQLVETQSGPYSWNRLERHGLPWSWAREWPESLSGVHRSVTREQEALTLRSLPESALESRPEIELLLCCARTRIDGEIAERMLTLLREDIDWDDVIAIALGHGVMPLLYQNLNRICPQVVPPAILDRLRTHFHTNALHNFLLTEELLKLLSLFEAHGIPAIPYKGPALAAPVYGNIVLRQFGDLDIVVPKRNMLRAIDLLIARGYQLQLTNPEERFFWRHRRHYHLVRDDGRVSVDICWAVSRKYWNLTADCEGSWERRLLVPLAATTVSSFSHEDLLLILCAHGADHDWQRLAWICDIAEVVSVQQRMNWGWLLEQSVRLRSQRPLFVGLALASDLLGATLPEEVVKGIQADQAVKVIAAQVRKRLFAGTDGWPAAVDSRPFYLRIRECMLGRMRYMLHSLANIYAQR
jgi:hypothetical protein